MRNQTGYRRVAAAFYNTPLAILPSKLAEIHAFLRLKFAGGEVEAETVERITAGRRGDGAGGGVQRYGRVGIVPIMGAISQRGGMMENSSEEMVSCEEVGAALDSLIADKTCKAICLLIDSPGGSVAGVPELASKINALKQDKKIVAMIDACGASAAYWIAAACSEVNICPSGQCGSIGVLSVHQDHSKELEKAGVKPTVITSSKYKAEGSPFSPLEDDARNEIQGKVDAFHDMFTASVARGRGVSESVVNKTFGQGRMLMAGPAKAAGMVDAVATFAQVLRRLGGDSDGPGNSSGAPSIGRASSEYLPLSARLASVRARACQVEVEASARPDNPPAVVSRPWSRQEAAARAAQVSLECGN